MTRNLVWLALSGCGASSACDALAHALPAVTPDVPGRVVAEPDDEIAPLFDPTELRTFALQLAPADLAALDSNPTAEQYVPGTITLDGQTYGPVGVRYKGSLGSWVGCVEGEVGADLSPPQGAKTCAKLSFKISFDEYDPELRFFGKKKILLHAMNNDPSLMRERLAYAVYRQMGVPAPRAVHARVLVNGEMAGLFLHVEQIDGAFTDSHFADGDGNLYKDQWPTHTPGLTAPVTAGRLAAALRTNEDEDPSFETSLTLSHAIESRDGEARARAIQQYLSVDNTARLFAVDRTLRADDGPFHIYCGLDGCFHHNFYTYEEEHAQRLWLIPWDMDLSFVVLGDGATETDDFVGVVDAWDDHEVSCLPHQGVTDDVLWQVPASCDPLINGIGCAFHDVFDAAQAELLTGPFSEGLVTDELDAWSTQVNEAVSEAAASDERQLTPAAWAAGLDELRSRVDHLRDAATR